MRRTSRETQKNHKWDYGSVEQLRVNVDIHRHIPSETDHDIYTRRKKGIRFLLISTPSTKTGWRNIGAKL